MSLQDAAEYWQGDGADVANTVADGCVPFDAVGMIAGAALVNARALEWLAARCAWLLTEHGGLEPSWTIWQDGKSLDGQPANVIIAEADTYHEALAAAVRAVKEQS